MGVGHQHDGASGASICCRFWSRGDVSARLMLHKIPKKSKYRTVSMYGVCYQVGGLGGEYDIQGRACLKIVVKRFACQYFPAECGNLNLDIVGITLLSWKHLFKWDLYFGQGVCI